MSSAEFLFDFGSPNAFLVHEVIPSIASRTGIDFEYVPVLLGGIFKATGNQSPFDAFAHIKNKPEYDELERDRFVRKHGIVGYGHNPHFPINTLMIMRGAVASRLLGMFDHYVDVVFDGMWRHHLKLDDPEVLAGVLRDNDLDDKRLFELAQDPAVKAELIANTESAVARGAFGSPTFFVDGEMYFGKDRLAEVEEAAVTALAEVA